MRIMEVTRIETTRCDYCGREVVQRYVIWDDCGYHYCRDCYSRWFTRCEACGDKIHREDAHTIDGKVFCVTCYPVARYNATVSSSILAS